MLSILDFIFSWEFVTYFLISLVPMLAWVYFFQKINKEKKSFVVLTFIAGMMAVLPIKLYEKYWGNAVFFFEHINLFTYFEGLLGMPELSSFLSYVIVNGLVAMLLFLFTAIMMFFLEVFTGDNTLGIFKQKVKKILEMPLYFLSIGVLCGIAAFIFSHLSESQVWASSSMNNKISFFVVVGMLEEFVKNLVLRFSDEEKIKSVDDAISFSIIIALGFAFVENIMYLRNFIANEGGSMVNVSILFILRSTISVVAHVCFSAILGYFYGVSRFAEEGCQQDMFRLRHPVIQKLHQILHVKKITLFHEEKMMEGMLLAMLAHAMFNALLHVNYLRLMVLFLVVLFIIVLNLFHRKKFHKKYRNIVQIT